MPAAERLKAAAQRIRTFQRQSINHIVEIGKELIRAKDTQLKHGQFGAWLTAGAPMP